MYEELRALFGKEKPSVSKFETILSELPPVRRLYYHRLAYKVALCEWEYLTVRYQLFLTHFFTRDWQRTLDYLLENTVLGTLQFELQEPDIIQRFIGQMESSNPYHKPSFVHLSFSYQLASKCKNSVEYLGDKLRTQTLTAEDLIWLNDKTLITNEPGHVPPRVK